jgi:hypothetical protein
VAKLAKAPVSKTGDSRFESWLPRRPAPGYAGGPFVAAPRACCVRAMANAQAEPQTIASEQAAEAIRCPLYTTNFGFSHA